MLTSAESIHDDDLAVGSKPQEYQRVSSINTLLFGSHSRSVLMGLLNNSSQQTDSSGILVRQLS